MERAGPGARILAAVSAHALRVVGVVVTALAAAVVWLSLSTEYGFAVPASATNTAGKTAASPLTVDALVAFAQAHPAYPVAIVLGLALLALGDDVPLLGD